MAEIRSHDGCVVFGQAAQQLVLKIISGGGHGGAVALLKRASALVYVFLETVVQILVAAALGDLGLIVELDFVDQQAGEALRLAVNVGVLGRKASPWVGGGGRSGCGRRHCRACRFNLDYFGRRFMLRRLRMSWLRNRRGYGDVLRAVRGEGVGEG